MPNRLSVSMSFADNLRAAMNRAGVNQSELGRRLGIKSQAVNQWLQPGGTAPRGTRLREVAAALDVSLSALLAEPPPNSEEAVALGYGQRLAIARAKRGESAAQFAAAIGVPVEMLLLWEAEALALDQPALTKLWRIGISADWVLFGNRQGHARPQPLAKERARPSRPTKGERAARSPDKEDCGKNVALRRLRPVVEVEGR